MKNLFVFIIITISSVNIRAQIIINEIMQSNIDCVMDDRNDFPDSWVELYNKSDNSISLSSYKIGETSDPNMAWQLPNQYLASKAFILVYCDNEQNGLHTNFKIDTGKNASIYLFKGEQIVDSITNLQKQPAPNISYGRYSETSSVFGYQEKPTPKQTNCKSICDKVLGNPVFSSEGVVTNKFNNTKIHLTLPPDSPKDTKIRYTLNGSEPTENSQIYNQPISLSTTTIVKAKLFHEGYLSPRATTHSYIEFNREMTLPIISITTNKDYLYDNKIGIYVDGNYNKDKKNYQYNWRRPINIELFENLNENNVLNQICEARIAGAASRGAKYKSIAIYANKRFGTKRFEYEFFPDQRPEQTNYKSLVLRNAGNDFDYLYMRDAIAQRTFAKHTDIDWQAWRPSIIYINGIYSGILNIRERGNEDNIYTNYEELENIDVVENWWDLKQGSMDNLNSFKNFFNEHGHTWEEYSEKMDLNEFINYYIMNAYFNNVDFPGNNLMMWRPRTENGKWRFIAKDLDYTIGIYNQQLYNYPYFTWLNWNEYDTNVSWANTYEATRLFRRLMEDNDFKREFIDHMSIYMGDFLNYNNIWDNIWEPMYNTIKYEYPYHRKLINQWWPNYNEELSNAQNWIKNRTDFMYNHLSDYYSLGKPIDLTINTPSTDGLKVDFAINFNGIRLKQNLFNGKFYQNRKIKLSADSITEENQYEISGWHIIQINNNGTRTQHIEGPLCELEMPDCSKLIINPVVNTYNDIDNIEIANSTNVSGYYDLQGRKYDNPQKGINIIRYKNGKTVKVYY